MTQTQQILAYLKKHRTITPLDALDLCGSFRLAARVHDLRSSGHQIHTVQIRPFARYRLVK